MPKPLGLVLHEQDMTRTTIMPSPNSPLASPSLLVKCRLRLRPLSKSGHQGRGAGERSSEYPHFTKKAQHDSSFSRVDPKLKRALYQRGALPRKSRCSDRTTTTTTTTTTTKYQKHTICVRSFEEFSGTRTYTRTAHKPELEGITM